MPITRRPPLLRTLLALSAGLLLVSAGLGVFLRLDRVSVAPGLLTGGSVAICVPRDGMIEKVLIRSGQTVRAGEPLVQIDTRQLQLEAASRLSAIDALEIRRRAAVAGLGHLQDAVQPKEREEAARHQEGSRLRLAQAEISAEATARLGSEGITGQLQVRQAELDRRIAAVAVEEAEQAVSLLQERHSAQRDAIAADIRRLEEEIHAESVQRDATVKTIEDSLLRASSDGVVATERVAELAGRSVRAGEEILRLAVAAPTRFEGMLSDLARTPVRPQQRVKIRLDGYPWLLHGTLKGQVVRVSERREAGAGFPVEVELDPATAPGLLTEGMRGTARIVVEEKISLLRLLLESATGRTGA